MKISIGILYQGKLLQLGLIGVALGCMQVATPVEAAPKKAYIDFQIRTDPGDLWSGKWLLQIVSIDNQARQLGQAHQAKTKHDGSATIKLPLDLFEHPLVIRANHICMEEDPGECRSFEIFVPPNCYGEALWNVGPFEDALWRFYRKAAMRGAEAWDPGQASCNSWVTSLQELDIVLDVGAGPFDEAAFVMALQENQHLLVATRDPICLAEHRHDGGSLERKDMVPIGAFEYALGGTQIVPEDEVLVESDGMVSGICGIDLDGQLAINGTVFTPDAGARHTLDDNNFDGLVFDQGEIDTLMDASVFVTRHGNGLELAHPDFDDVCSTTTLVEVTNKDDDEQDALTGSGVTLTDLFDAGDDTLVYLTSDGDQAIDSDDVWAILYSSNDALDEARVLTVSLLGHRQEDFRDVLHLQLSGPGAENLSIALRADYELNEEEVDGERAFFGYTMTSWDSSSDEGRQAIRRNFLGCYEAADEWARQYFDPAEIGQEVSPFVAAEAEVRSQCFSNSRSQQRWQIDDVGFWMMNTHHGVRPNLAVNPGWLAPGLDFEIYIKKFDEAVFKGPRTIKTTDESGQLMTAIPTLVDGDSVIIKSEDSCCDDYDLVLTCDATFGGFP